jgi:hypothetical protein
MVVPRQAAGMLREIRKLTNTLQTNESRAIK